MEHGIKCQINYAFIIRNKSFRLFFNATNVGKHTVAPKFVSNIHFVIYVENMDVTVIIAHAAVLHFEINKRGCCKNK